MEEKVLIKFRNIVKEFDGTIVLKGINLDIYENEFVTLLGPSGCGKRTQHSFPKICFISTYECL